MTLERGGGSKCGSICVFVCAETGEDMTRRSERSGRRRVRGGGDRMRRWELQKLGRQDREVCTCSW